MVAATITSFQDETDVDLLFREHVGYIKTLARKFKERYGADYDELLSEADTIFMRAVRTHNPERRFTNWLGFLLMKLWMENMRRRAMRNTRLPCVWKDMSRVRQPVQPSFDILGLLDQLSDDAKTVVKLVIEPSPNIDLNVAERGGKDTPRNVRCAVKEHLRDLKWTWKRIRESFQEIERALR
jgi:hypothetical protein